MIPKLFISYNRNNLILVAEVRAFHYSIPKSNRMSKVSLLATVTSVAKGDRSYLQTRSCDCRIVIKAVLKVVIKKCKEEGKLRLDYPSSSRMTDWENCFLNPYETGIQKLKLLAQELLHQKECGRKEVVNKYPVNINNMGTTQTYAEDVKKHWISKNYFNLTF